MEGGRSLPFPTPAIRFPLIAVRHGQTDWNAEGRLQGQCDIPLNDTGRAQAARNGKALAEHLGQADGWRFVASPLERAVETMRILRAEMGLPPDDFAREAALKEASFGAWEGLTMDELKVKDRAAYRLRKDDRWGALPPGGESYAMLGERVAAWIARLDGPTVTVSHGGVVRVLRALVDGDDGTLFNGPPAQDRILSIADGAATWF